MHQNLIDHLQVFLAVVERESLSGAARQLGRAVSTISYAIDRLEDQYGFALFERGTGGFRLTKEGRGLLREAQLAVESARRFEARANTLESGAETALRIGVDVLFPNGLLVECLNRFGAANPQVRVQIFSTSLNQSWRELMTGQVDFSLAPLRKLPPSVERKPLLSEELIVIAAADHPLTRLPGPIPQDELRSHRQLYYAAPDVDVEHHGRIFSNDFWTASDLGMLRVMACAGVGWCFATRDWARSSIDDGQLVELSLTDMLSDGVWTFGAVWQIDQPPGLLGSQFLSTLEQLIDISQRTLAVA